MLPEIVLPTPSNFHVTHFSLIWSFFVQKIPLRLGVNCIFLQELEIKQLYFTMSSYTFLKSPELTEILQFPISLSEWRPYNSPSSCIKCSGESCVVVVVRSIIIHVGVGFGQASTGDRLFVSIQTRITTLILLSHSTIQLSLHSSP